MSDARYRDVVLAAARSAVRDFLNSQVGAVAQEAVRSGVLSTEDLAREMSEQLREWMDPPCCVARLNGRPCRHDGEVEVPRSGRRLIPHVDELAPGERPPAFVTSLGTVMVRQDYSGAFPAERVR